MEHGHEEEIHISVWPVVVGAAAFLLYLGLGWPFEGSRPVVLGLGLVAVVVAVAGWMREDFRLFPRYFYPPGYTRGEGAHVGFWGTVYFLCTEFMLFGALFAGYFAFRGRAGAEVWETYQPEFPMGLITINTVILITSGFTMHWAQNRIAENQRRKFLWGCVATLVLGGIFLALQVNEYISLIDEGFVLGKNALATSFFMITGTHGFHVFVGLVAISVMLIRGAMGNFDKEHHVAVEGVTLYWHFVDAVWVFVYVVLYLRWL